MAVNYMEDGTLPEKPAINAFHKAATAVIGDGDTMVLPDAPATIFEGEAEMALVIGKRATRVAPADAFKHIFGYTCFIDGSARGVGRFAGLLKLVQSGYLYWYALVMILGLLGLMTWQLWPHLGHLVGR